MNDLTPVFVLGSYVSAFTVQVGRLPAPSETVRADAFLLEAGGKGLNVSIGARRLGAEVDGVIAVGDDPLSGMAADALARADLPARMLVRFPGPGGAGVGLIDADAENVIAVFAGANARLSARDIAAAADRLVASGCVVAQFEIGDEPVAEAFALARRAGVRTILNPSPYRPIPPSILSATDIIVVNATEATALLDGVAGGETPPRTIGEWDRCCLADRLLSLGVEAVVLTLGAQGAIAWRRGAGPVRQEGFPVEAVDSTGCGDAFLAGLVVALSEARSWPTSLAWAAACGAMTATRIGVLAALPTRAALLSAYGRLLDRP